MQSRQQIKKLPDNDLVLTYRTEGDRYCLAELFERYMHFVFCVSMKYLHDADSSQDATMQVFMKLMDDLKVHDIKQFKPWLHTVVKNHCLMLLRSAKPTSSFEQFEKKVADGRMEFSSEQHLDGMEKESQLKSLEKAICLLKPEQQNCIDLFYIQEKSYSEVSQLTGYSMNEVKTYIQNGKRNLKQILVKSGDFKLLAFLILLDALI